MYYPHGQGHGNHNPQSPYGMSYPYGGPPQYGYPPPQAGYPPPQAYPPQQGYPPPPQQGYPPPYDPYQQQQQQAYPPPQQYPPQPQSYQQYPPQQQQYAPVQQNSAGGYLPPPPVYNPTAVSQYPPQQQGAYPGAPPQGRRKKALLVGCNYIGNDQARLNGCINDATYLRYLLLSKFGFQDSEMLILTDDLPDPSRKPTRANLINAFNWLTAGALPGDSLFFSFSGHGGQVRDRDGDEGDGMDETILPMDYKTAGSIVDDDLHVMLAARIPMGARLTCIMDCCHSGTGLDLPFVYPK